jgi:transposase
MFAHRRGRWRVGFTPPVSFVQQVLACLVKRRRFDVTVEDRFAD